MMCEGMHRQWGGGGMDGESGQGRTIVSVRGDRFLYDSCRRA